MLPLLIADLRADAHAIVEVGPGHANVTLLGADPTSTEQGLRFHAVQPFRWGERQGWLK